MLGVSSILMWPPTVSTPTSCFNFCSLSGHHKTPYMLIFFSLFFPPPFSLWCLHHIQWCSGLTLDSARRSYSWWAQGPDEVVEIKSRLSAYKASTLPTVLYLQHPKHESNIHAGLCKMGGNWMWPQRFTQLLA